MIPGLFTSFGAPAWVPELSPAALAFFRVVYGALLTATLVRVLPHARRFFVSERWRGYVQSTAFTDRFQSPSSVAAIMALWIGCGVLITVDRLTVPAAAINLVLCRYFFIQTRWRSVLRGMGAPGFMTYWLAAANFLLVGAARHAPNLLPLVLFTLQVDFALIMFSAGLYKLKSGYPHNHGMELGMVNPQWGYWWRRYAAMPPGHVLFRFLNHLAWATEIGAAVLMVVPPTRFLGALLIIGSFAFIASQIRLGWLCHMVMLGGVIFFHPGSWGDGLANLLFGVPSVVTSVADPVVALPPLASGLLQVTLLGYVCLLPLAHIGLWLNMYGRRSLPRPLQGALEAFTNAFGVIVWRVFTADLVNFYVLVYRDRPAGGSSVFVSRYDSPTSLRYTHVAEMITITSIFTTLKYYPDRPELFRERLLRYAASVPCPPECVLRFRYVSLRKADLRFESQPVIDYVVDLAERAVTEVPLADVSIVHAPHAYSPLHPGQRPGSYVPAAAAAGAR